MKIKNTYIKKKEYIEKEEEMILKLFVKTYEELIYLFHKQTHLKMCRTSFIQCLLALIHSCGRKGTEYEEFSVVDKMT